MDTGDLEREKGITILAKNTAVHYTGAVRAGGHDDQHHRHPRPRRLRRRGRARAVDGRRHRAAGRRQRGPAPADPVRAGQGAERRHARRAGGQQGRPRRRPDRRGRRRDLRAVHGPARREPQPGRARLPGRLRQRQGRHRQPREAGRRRPCRTAPTSSRCSAPSSRPSRRRRTSRARRCRRTSPTSTPRRSSAGWRCCGSTQGTLRKGQNVAWIRRDGEVKNVKVTELLVTEGLERKPGEQAGPGDIVAVAGIPEITIGETLADPEHPVAAAADPRRRAGHLDDHRHQHLAAGRPGQGPQGHRAAGQGPARRRAGRQRVAEDPADRAPRRLGGAGPRRAGAGDPGRADAPRGLRAHRRQAAGGHPRDRRQGARADGAADHRRARGVPRHHHRAARHPQGPAWSR